MPDQRTETEKAFDAALGKPLYYCKECLKAVKVTVEGDVVTIKRPCSDTCDSEVIAPRRAITHGEGGLNISDKIKVIYHQIYSALTGRCG